MDFVFALLRVGFVEEKTKFFGHVHIDRAEGRYRRKPVVCVDKVQRPLDKVPEIFVHNAFVIFGHGALHKFGQDARNFARQRLYLGLPLRDQLAVGGKRVFVFAVIVILRLFVFGGLGGNIGAHHGKLFCLCLFLGVQNGEFGGRIVKKHIFGNKLVLCQNFISEGQMIRPRHYTFVDKRITRKALLYIQNNIGAVFKAGI